MASFDKVKVVFIDHTARLSGGEIALLRLIDAIDSSKFAIEVILFEAGELADALEQRGISARVLPLHSSVLNTRKDTLAAGAVSRVSTMRYVVEHIHRVSQELRKLNPAIVHTNSLKADIIGGIASKIAGIPVVWHIRDRIENDYLPSFATKVFRFMARMIPDFVIANSKATLATLHLPSRKPSSVVHGGLPATQISKRRESLESSKSNKVVGLVGRISPWKGQIEFVEAASIVLKTHPDVRFKIVGSALFGEEAYLEAVKKRIVQLGCQNEIELLGFRSNIEAELLKFDIFVHASNLPEPFGQTVIEAMAAGLPVIATAAGAIPEIITDRQNGILVAPADSVGLSNAIIELLEKPEFANEIAALGQETVRQRFTTAIVAGNVQQVYSQVLGLV